MPFVCVPVVDPVPGAPASSTAVGAGVSQPQCPRVSFWPQAASHPHGFAVCHAPLPTSRDLPPWLPVPTRSPTPMATPDPCARSSGTLSMAGWGWGGRGRGSGGGGVFIGLYAALPDPRPAGSEGSVSEDGSGRVQACLLGLAKSPPGSPSVSVLNPWMEWCPCPQPPCLILVAVWWLQPPGSDWGTGFTWRPGLWGFRPRQLLGDIRPPPPPTGSARALFHWEEVLWLLGGQGAGRGMPRAGRHRGPDLWRVQRRCGSLPAWLAGGSAMSWSLPWHGRHGLRLRRPEAVSWGWWAGHGHSPSRASVQWASVKSSRHALTEAGPQLAACL